MTRPATWAPLLAGGLAHLFQLLLGGIAVIGAALGQQALGHLKRELAQAPVTGTRQTIPLRDKETNWICLAKFEEKT